MTASSTPRPAGSLAALAVLPLLTLFCGGCVVFPHSGWIAPEASGHLQDATTRQPIQGATVRRHVHLPGRTRTATTDAAGRFVLPRQTQMRWLPFVCHAPHPMTYTFESAQHAPLELQRRGGGDFAQGRTAHDFGTIALQRRAGD